MNKQSIKLMNLPEESFILKRTETQLDKLLNIKRTAQFQEIDLQEDDVKEITILLEGINFKLKENKETINRFNNVRSEAIAMTFGEEFI